MRGLDRNEWKVLHWASPNHNEEYPRFYHPACYRLIARGLVYVEVCDRGHKHLVPTYLAGLAIRCHLLATSKLEV
jgi:hypothetical protein